MRAGSPPTGSSNLLVVMESQSEERWLEGKSAKNRVFQRVDGLDQGPIKEKEELCLSVNYAKLLY